MIVYWYGEIEAEGEDSLLARFFAKAPDALRAEAIRFLGMSLRRGKFRPGRGPGTTQAALGDSP